MEHIADSMQDTELIANYIPHASQIMWFLGAGTSRSARMPTANDIIWNLKKLYYCREENIDINTQDLNNKTIKKRIQNYMESKGFPPLWSSEEYSFYFKLLFGEDYEAQQGYLRDALSPEKVSLNVGHRILAALMELKKAKLVFTTNFDSVIENAYAFVANKSLDTYHLEGAYAALAALNNELFPIYAKIHGDFRYQSIKNLPEDLQQNDVKIQECFLAASSRFGMIVSGYSGRDANVMEMFEKAIEQNNAFPFGLYWTTTGQFSTIDQRVLSLIKKSKELGIKAAIAGTGTFDTFLSKIWRQTPERSKELDEKVWPAHVQSVNIPLPSPSNVGFPIIRTNALMIRDLPNECAEISLSRAINHSELKDIKKLHLGRMIATLTDKILCFGSAEYLHGIFKDINPVEIKTKKFEDIIELIRDSTLIKAFLEEALAYALVNGKPLSVRKRGGYSIVVSRNQFENPLFDDLRNSIRTQRYNKDVVWNHNKIITCCESLNIRLEIKNNNAFLLMKPDIWITPIGERENIRATIDNIKKTRYNDQTFKILSSWINLLLGEIKEKSSDGHSVPISYFEDSEFPVKFTINTRSAYSRPGAK